MVTNDLFYVVWRNVLRHYVWGIQMVEALMRRYGFGRLRLQRRMRTMPGITFGWAWPGAPDLGWAFGQELEARELAMRQHYVDL